MCDTPGGSSPPPRTPPTSDSSSGKNGPTEHPKGVWSALGPNRAQEDEVSEIWQECDACQADDPRHVLTAKLCTRHRQERQRVIAAGIRGARAVKAAEETALADLVAACKLTMTEADGVREALQVHAMFVQLVSAPMSPAQHGAYLDLAAKFLLALSHLHAVQSAGGLR